MSDPTPEQIKSALKNTPSFNGASDWVAGVTVYVSSAQVLAYIQKLEGRVMTLACVLAEKLEGA